MSNMSYCRFENTAQALHDCELNWEENSEELSDHEKSGKEMIVDSAKEILEMEGYTVNKDE